MNRHEILMLQSITEYPALSITLPTHRTSPDNKQDPIRVKNLVKEATERLQSEFNKRELSSLLTRLDALTNDIDYTYALDGLAMFVNANAAYKFYLPFSIPERVVVDETFYTRNLVFAMNRTPRYWVLALSDNATRLYEGTHADLAQVETDGFPLSHEGPGAQQTLPGGVGVNRSAIRDEFDRQFFRRVDETLKPFLQDDPLPLIVVGVDRNLAFFNEVTNHADAILATLQGAHDKTSPHELSKLVWPLVQEKLAEQRAQVFEELDKAVSEQKFVSGAGEAWRLAREGRGKLLVVEQDYHFPARVDETGMFLTPTEDTTDADVVDDAVDEIIETVLSKGGRVRFVENGTLDAHQRIALILRY